MSRFIWPKSSPRRVERSLSAHFVMGLVVSAALYLVCLSGTLAVFQNELEWWERPEPPAVTQVTPAAVQMAAESGMALEPDTRHLYVFLPRADWPRFVVATDNEVKALNPDGRLAGEHSGLWSGFLIDLHYYLTMPHSFGMIIVGLLGVMLIAMTLSGFMAHPRVFRDAFHFRRTSRRRLSQTDWHNRLSVWTAPFSVTVALTGAMIGLFVVFAAVITETSFDGDSSGLIEPIFGAEPDADLTPAPLADLSPALTYAAETFPATQPMFFIVHDPATRGQSVQLLSEHKSRLIYAEYYNFNGAGEFLSKTGMSDGDIGRQVAFSVYRLHFGQFGGIWVKLLYGILGLALSAVCASGLNIYFAKRADKGRPQPRLQAVWAGFVWGVPVMLAALFALTLLAAPGTGLMTALFWAGAAGICVFGAALGRPAALCRYLQMFLAATLLLLPVMHGIRYGFRFETPHLALTSLAMIVAGLWALWLSRRGRLAGTVS